MKQKRVDSFNEWAKKNGYKLEIDGFLDADKTIYGVIETPRGARYFVRAFTLSEHDYPEGKTIIVRSSKSANYSNPNSIKMLVNGQIVKGKKIGSYNYKKDFS